MASKVLVKSSHLYPAQTSALGTSSSGTSKHTSQFHGSVASSRAFHHQRPPTKTYVIGVNYGIAYPNNVEPTCGQADPVRPYGAEEGQEEEEIELSGVLVQGPVYQSWGPPEAGSFKDGGEIRAEAEGSRSPDRGLHNGACVGVETKHRRGERWTQQERAVPHTGANQRCERSAGEGGQRPQNTGGGVMQIVEDVSTLPPPASSVAMLQTSARSNPETCPVRAGPAQHHGGAEATPVVRAVVDGAEATHDGSTAAMAAHGGLEAAAGAAITRVSSVDGDYQLVQHEVLARRRASDGH